jgi:hypothetical protein
MHNANIFLVLTAGAQGTSALEKLPKSKETGRVLVPLQPIVMHKFLTLFSKLGFNSKKT